MAEASSSGPGGVSGSGRGAEKEMYDTSLDYDFRLQIDDDKAEDIPPEKRKTMFSKELRCMLYGFGDDHNPFTEFVDLLEDMVVNYIAEMTKEAMVLGRPGRVEVENILYLIHREPTKYSRVKELLTMNEELRKARKAF
ncbi:Transcription initiation factor TFIID subunit 13 [Nucella lapillus]